MMKKVASIILALLMLVSLAACGSSDVSSDDPNVGMWTAVSASMLGITTDIDEVFDQGASLELKANGKYVLTLDGENGNGKWTYEDGGLAFTSSEFDFYGSVESDILTLENLMDTGLSINFEKEDKQE